MKFIFLDNDGNVTHNEMNLALNLSAIRHLPPLSEYLCCKIIDPIIGHINLAISLNYNKVIAKFVVNNYEIHSLVKFNKTEEKIIKKFFKKYT